MNIVMHEPTEDENILSLLTLASVDLGGCISDPRFRWWVGLRGVFSADSTIMQGTCSPGNDVHIPYVEVLVLDSKGED